MMEKLSMCRICLVENVRMHAVVNKSLQELYEKLTDVPFVTKDARPMLACFFCCTKIKQCAQFQRKCLEAEQLFTQMLNEDHEAKPSLNHGKLEFAGGYVTTPVELISIDAECQEERDVIKQEPHYIIEPKEEYQSDEQELKHLHNSYSDVEGEPLQHAESEDIPPQYSEEDSAEELPLMEFKTEVVEDQDISTDEQRTREMIRLPIVRIPRLDSRATQPEDTVTDKQQENVLLNTVGHLYICNICQHSFTSKSSLRNHILKHTKPYKCDVCQRCFSQSRYLTTHIRVHTDTKPYKCDVCQRCFSQNRYLTTHNRVHTGEKRHKCGMCQLGFSRSTGLINHMRMHTGEKPFSCEICQRSFRQKGALISHIRTHTGEKPHKCEMCQESFTRSTGLTYHMRTHTGENPFICEICQRGFSNKNSLTVHIRTHTGEKPYKCEMCQLSFSSKGNLTVHTRQHTGEKPYKCKICPVSFGGKKGLNQHMRTHSGEKPYKCDNCPRRFRQKASLISHNRLHTGDRP